MMRKLVILFFLATIMSCSKDNQYEKNMDRLDQVYGECDNPMKTLTKRQYKICKDKERSGGESFFNLEDGFDEIFYGKNSQVIYSNKINQDLWVAALNVTDNYSLKIADNNGGIIETDWIYDSIDPKKRCLIKIKILSADLVSNGVSTKFICQNQNLDNIWVSDSEDYTEEEKRLTLKILQTASSINQSAG